MNGLIHPANAHTLSMMREAESKINQPQIKENQHLKEST